MKTLVLILQVPLAAQLAISPASVTLQPGQSVTFHSSAVSPFWLRAGTVTGSFACMAPGPADCVFTAPAAITAIVQTQVKSYDASNWSLQPAVAIVTLSPATTCQTCPPGPAGPSGPIGPQGSPGVPGPKGDTGGELITITPGPDYLVKFLTFPNAPGLCGVDVNERNAYTYDDLGYLYICMRTNEVDADGNFTIYRWKKSPAPFLVVW